MSTTAKKQIRRKTREFGNLAAGDVFPGAGCVRFLVCLCVRQRQSMKENERKRNGRINLVDCRGNGVAVDLPFCRAAAPGVVLKS
jgi:hypothetical protein